MKFEENTARMLRDTIEQSDALEAVLENDEDTVTVSSDEDEMKLYWSVRMSA